MVPIDVREFIENTIATDLADVYRGIENIFLRIAREVDMHVPTEVVAQKSTCPNGGTATGTTPRDFRKYLSPIGKTFWNFVTKSRISMVGNWL